MKKYEKNKIEWMTFEWPFVPWGYQDLGSRKPDSVCTYFSILYLFIIKYYKVLPSVFLMGLFFVHTCVHWKFNNVPINGSDYILQGTKYIRPRRVALVLPFLSAMKATSRYVYKSKSPAMECESSPSNGDRCRGTAYCGGSCHFSWFTLLERIRQGRLSLILVPWWIDQPCGS